MPERRERAGVGLRLFPRTSREGALLYAVTLLMEAFLCLPSALRPAIGRLGTRAYDEVVAVMPTGCQTSGVLMCECWWAAGGASSGGADGA